MSITRLFGTNGIRGIPSENFTLKFISEVSLSIGSFFKKGPILVGHDGRVTSPIIYDAVSSSLMASANSFNVSKAAGAPPTKFPIAVLMDVLIAESVSASV